MTHRNHDVRVLCWPQHAQERDWGHENPPGRPTRHLITCLSRSSTDLVLRATTLADCLGCGISTSARRNVLDQYVGRLRRKIAPVGLSIRTVWGCGYLLEADEDALPARDSESSRAAG